MNEKSGVLDGKKEIAKFLHDPGEKKMKQYVKMGLPVKIINGRWFAHKFNIEKWFKEKLL